MISVSDYQIIVCLLDDAHSLMGDIIGATYDLQLNLDNTFMYGSQRANLQSSLNQVKAKLGYESMDIVNFIKALQQHVVDNYGLVRDFVYDNGIVVPAYVAKISDMLGYHIDNSCVVGHCP